MKKTLLFGIVAMSMCSTSIFAQQKTLIGAQPELAPYQINMGAYTPKSAIKADKHTRATSRWYNQADAVGQQDGTNLFDNDHANFNYLWQDSTIRARFGATYGGVWVKSLSQILDPHAFIFNDPSLFGGAMQADPTKSYSIDSVAFTAVYLRNPARAAVVDTLIITVGRGNNAPTDCVFFKESQPAVVGPYNIDTIFVATPKFDFITNTLKKDVGSLAFTKKIPLTVATLGDTIPGGWNVFSFPVTGLQNLAPGSLGVMTVNFKSGDTWIPNVDSISETGDGRNYMLFASSRENAPAGFRYYTKGDYNSSGIKKNDTTGWAEYYIPSFYFNSPAFEFHWIDWKLSCPTCDVVGNNPNATNDISLFNNVAVYPNPASNQLSVLVNLTEEAKNVTLDITNALGQVVKKVELGNVHANQTSGQIINISDLSQGVYIYTIRANGQTMSNKLMVN